MNATRKVKLKDITANLSCKLCLGYLVDATTIIECLHSFCKSCIINYLDKSEKEEKYCPICDVQLHSTKPLTSIRSDLMLQEIVYKLVPGLFKSEMRRRRHFYDDNDDAVPVTPLDSGQVFDDLYITSDDIMHLSMEYVTDDEKLRENTKRYFKCPAAVPIFVLKKLLLAKYDLDAQTNIDVLFGDRILPDDFLLMDVAYKYSWTMNWNKPLTLRYRMKGQVKPVIRFDKVVKETDNSTVEPVECASKEELQTPPASKKKVCNENGSNIMPTEEIIPNQIKMPTNGLIPGDATIPPIKNPNGKIKGRKRKQLNYSDIVIESKDDIKKLTKRLKLEKAAKTSTPKKKSSESSFNAQTQVEIIPTKGDNEGPNRQVNGKDVKEVQLQISENGVMSARSVSCNGDDKVVFDLSKRLSKPPVPITTANLSTSPNTPHDISLTEKLLLSGNCHSKTGPSGVTEIICDKPGEISKVMKPLSARPGYVTLNIPTPKNPITFASTQMSVIDKPKISGQNGLLSPSTKFEKIPINNKSELLDKGKQKSGDEDNGGKTVVELGKFGMNAVINAESGTLNERQKLTGLHSLPIIAPPGSPFQQQLQRVKPLNGQGKSPPLASTNFTLPLALNFSPASGMSVSMIPCTSNGTVNGSHLTTTTTSPWGTSVSTTPSISILTTTTPPKRVAHQTSVINNDLKFTKSPKPILPKLDGNNDPPPSIKKPPKFFKSRRTSSPGAVTTSIPNGKLTTSKNSKNDNKDTKRKVTSVVNGSNGGTEPPKKKICKDRRDQVIENNSSTNAFGLMKFLSSGVLAASMAQANNVPPGQYAANTNSNGVPNGIQISRPQSYPSHVNDKYSQHLTALSNLAAVNPADLSSGLAAVAAAAAAASGGNGLPMGMVPLVTDNYCSLPFLNQRTNMAQFPFGYNYPTIGYSIPGSTTNITTAITTPVNSSKPKTVNTPSGNNSRILNSLLSTPASTKEGKKGPDSTLDLSVTKSAANEATTTSQASNSNCNPVLVSLLNSSSSKLPDKAKSGSKTPSPVSNGQTSKPNSEEKAKSPLIRQLLEKKEEKEKTRAVSQNLYPAFNGSVNGDVKKNKVHENGKIPHNGTKLADAGLQIDNSKRSPESSPTAKQETSKGSSNPEKSPTTKSLVPIIEGSPKASSDSNISSSSVKISLDKETLMCLSVQNNNIHTLTNHHDKPANSPATKDIKSDSLNCSSALNGNSEKRDDNAASPATTKLSS